VSNTLASLRRKIDGAVKLKSVVRTMKAVAASSIGQYEAAVRSLSDYEHSVELGLSVCFRQNGASSAPSQRRSGKPAVTAIVFGSDQGLVGQFNEAVAAFTQTKLGTISGEKKLWIVGERVGGSLADSDLPVAARFAVPTSVDGITQLVEQFQIAMEKEEEKPATEVYVFHARPTSGALYETVCQRLLPFDADWQKGLAKIPWPTKNPPEIFGHTDSTMRALIREYLFIVLFRACAESLASENANRLAAMQRAEKNIDSLSKDLSRRFSRLRQNSIDEELFDVIAGFNSLSTAQSRHAAT
jgi:F-type H+-transporting ATPase subunit gamma